MLSKQLVLSDAQCCLEITSFAMRVCGRLYYFRTTMKEGIESAVVGGSNALVGFCCKHAKPSFVIVNLCIERIVITT